MPLSTNELTDALRLALREDDITISERSPLAAGSHPKEAVVCLLEGSEVKLLCKYDGPEDRGHVGVHRGGVSYEIDVYTTVLQPLGRADNLLGTCIDPPVLVMRLLDPWRYSSRTKDLSGPLAAVRWLGAFHRDAEEIAGTGDCAFLRTYGLDYFVSLGSRAERFAAPLRHRFPWFGAFVFAWPEFAAELVDGPETIVHGEFFPRNVLLTDHDAVPVDWEGAARCCGEVDLASLIERWPDDVGETLAQAYAEARWPASSSTLSKRRLTIARAYWALRRLGDRPEWTIDPDVRPFFDDLYLFAGRLGLHL